MLAPLAIALASHLAGITQQVADAHPLARFIDSSVSTTTFAGTIQVRRRDSVLYARSFGVAERAFAVPNTHETRYRIASITKAFTGVLISQLMEQRRLSPATTIGKVLPWYEGPARDIVTVEQLLRHTSGLANMDSGVTVESALSVGLPAYQRPWTLAQMVRQYASGHLSHPPGGTFDYNNADYLILGAIIESIYGKSYDVVLREKILQPAGMTSSGVAFQHAVIPRLATGYFFREDLSAMAPDLPIYPENWHAAGAMYSTVDDLMRFVQALFGGETLLTEESRERMLVPGLDDYGYGVWSFTRNMNGTTYHVMRRPGQIMGAQAQLYHVIEPALTVVILTNANKMDLDRFVADIANLALQHE